MSFLHSNTERGVHVLTRQRLVEFWKKHPDAEEPLKAWLALMKAGRFRNSHDLKTRFGSADFLGGRKTVFDIGGNKYRLVAVIWYETGQVHIKHVLTHSEYDRLTRSGGL